MLKPQLEIKVERWIIQSFSRATLFSHRLCQLPKAPAAYVLHQREHLYVGQSGDAFRRVRTHMKDEKYQQVVFIFGADQDIHPALLNHIEFGLILLAHGADLSLLNHQIDIPHDEETETKIRALAFFNQISENAENLAHSILGAYSQASRRAMKTLIKFLRIAWR